MTATPTRFIRASIVNEGKVEVGDVLIARDGTIGAVGAACDQHPEASEAIQIDAQGLWLMPGAIDDQVHFREPGLTHKGKSLQNPLLLLPEASPRSWRCRIRYRKH